MEVGEVFFFKATCFQQYHRERIAHHEHVRRTGSRGKIKRAGFALNIDVEDVIRCFCQCGCRFSRHSDDRGAKTLQMRKHREELGSLTGIAHGEDDITFIDQAKIAVKGILTV